MHMTAKEYGNDLLGCAKNLSVALAGVIALLFGMWLFSFFCSGVLNSIVNIFALIFSIVLVIRYTNIEKALQSSKVPYVTIIIITSVVLVNIWLGDSFVYNDFLYGHSTSLSEHDEHSLMFTEMSTIATRLKSGASLQEATYDLPLYQYYNIFVYSSMMFLLGGVNPTNMCIWNAFHAFLCSVLLVLILVEYGVRDKNHLAFAYFVSMLQPLNLSVNTYNKVIIGNALIMVALYVYMSTYESPKKNLFCFPVYSYLFWTVRMQYFVIASFLLLYCLFRNDRSRKAAIPAVIAVSLLSFFVLRLGLSQLYHGMNFGYYHGSSDFSISTIPARIVRSFLPYFPLSNIFYDEYWHFNIFCIAQEIMNITLWGLVFMPNGRLSSSCASRAVKNPLILTAFALLLGGTLSELHTTYLSVGTMLLPSSCPDVSFRKCGQVYLVVFLCAIVLTVIYLAFGLRGAGLAGIK